MIGHFQTARPERWQPVPLCARTVLGLRFAFRNADGSIEELPVMLGQPSKAPHRPLDRKKTWLDVQRGNRIILCWPGTEPQIRAVDEVILWMSQPSVESLPLIVSGRHWEQTAEIVLRRR